MQEERWRKDEEKEHRVVQLMMLKLSTACYHYDWCMVSYHSRGTVTTGRIDYWILEYSIHCSRDDVCIGNGETSLKLHKE